jgi:retron-type reverse transcriptase
VKRKEIPKPDGGVRLLGIPKDKRVLKLIRSYLTVGVMIDGVVVSAAEGTPQGGPLTPWSQKVTLSMIK